MCAILQPTIYIVLSKLLYNDYLKLLLFAICGNSSSGTLLESRLICFPAHQIFFPVHQFNSCNSCNSCQLTNWIVASNILLCLLQPHLPNSLSLPRASGLCFLATAALIVTPIVKQADGANIKKKVPVSFGSKIGAVQNHIWCLFAAFLWLNPPPITTAYMQSRPQCSSMYTVHDTICIISTTSEAKQIRVQNYTLSSSSSLLWRVI